ncbi:MAG: hypothetical protein Q3966_09040 [Neisseria sp.]|nr:hypothetical protein [Neisseria sp.]MDO4879415.1 hypothetical protein [Neisseria sp.]
MWKITKDDSQDLSFARNCLSTGAINIDEFKLWLETVIRDNPIDNIPHYVWDILYPDNSQKLNSLDIYKIIGFPSSDILSRREYNAVYGIAYTRFPDYGTDWDEAVSKKTALKALQNNPHIMERFRKFFPFIEI